MKKHSTKKQEKSISKELARKIVLWSILLVLFTDYLYLFGWDAFNKIYVQQPEAVPYRKIIAPNQVKKTQAMKPIFVTKVVTKEDGTPKVIGTYGRSYLMNQIELTAETELGYFYLYPETLQNVKEVHFVLSPNGPIGEHPNEVDIIQKWKKSEKGFFKFNKNKMFSTGWYAIVLYYNEESSAPRYYNESSREEAPLTTVQTIKQGPLFSWGEDSIGVHVIPMAYELGIQ